MLREPVKRYQVEGVLVDGKKDAPGGVFASFVVGEVREWISNVGKLYLKGDTISHSY